ncbi:MAG TPA: hypothetical protein VIV40_30075, partial [Kofleriaceae bacterium]
PVAIQIPDTPDTIPDISPALAETHAAPPTPVGMRITATPPSTIITDPNRAQPRRYAIVAFFAVIPLAVGGFVLFRSLNQHSGAPADRGAGSAVNAPADNGSAIGTQPVLEQAQTVDAGVADAAAVELAPPPPVDAGVKVKKPDRHRPRVTPDAGAQQGLPDIDFIDVNKKK